MTTTNFRLTQSAISAVTRLSKDEHRPYCAMLEIADRCNEVCIHCYQVQGMKGEMTTEQVRSVMDQLAEMGVLFLTISGGEPTLRPDFLELVAHARSLKFAVKIYTNGLRIDDVMAERLAELAVQEVQISLYSPHAEAHDWVTRVPGSHEKSIAAARSLLSRGVHVVLKSPVMKFNASDRAKYVALVQDIGADYMLDSHVDPREDGTRDPELLRVSHEEDLDIRRDPLLYESRDVETTLRAPLVDTAPCGACSGAIHIEANGEMQPCTLMSTPVGHVLEEGGVAKAWESNPNGLLLRHLTYADIHGCRDCALQPYCHRCYANALMQGGDALGPYREACEHARVEYELSHGVAPAIEAEDPSMGPYAARSQHSFVVVDDNMGEPDEVRYRRYPWLRAPAAPQPTLQSDGLVQIRRPGAARPEVVEWPGDSD